jgi:hypothetical protein
MVLYLEKAIHYEGRYWTAISLKNSGSGIWLKQDIYQLKY